MISLWLYVYVCVSVALASEPGRAQLQLPVESEAMILDEVNMKRQFHLRPLLQHSPALSAMAERRAQETTLAAQLPAESESIQVEPVPGGSVVQITISVPSGSMLSPLFQFWIDQGRCAGHTILGRHVKDFGVGSADSRRHRTWVILLLGDNHPVEPPAASVEAYAQNDDDNDAPFVFNDATIIEDEEGADPQNPTPGPGIAMPDVPTSMAIDDEEDEDEDGEGEDGEDEGEGDMSYYVDLDKDEFEDEFEEDDDEDADEEIGQDDDGARYRNLLAIAQNQVPGA